jgi:hypothetical protein
MYAWRIAGPGISRSFFYKVTYSKMIPLKLAKEDLFTLVYG